MLTGIVNNLTLGFGVALTPEGLLYCLIGATVGTLVGVLPGIGPTTAIAMLLPLTFKIPATASLIMLSGIYYGSHHAGSTTAIMLNMPGEPTSVIICADGHPMARQGKAGVALFISAISSTFAGFVGVIIIALFAPALAGVALAFASPEYAATVVLALVVASALSSGSILVTVGMSILGVLLGCIGTDVNTGVIRFAFGQANLEDGISVIAVAVGLFAFAETVRRLRHEETKKIVTAKLTSLIPSWLELRRSAMPILRGTLLGGAFGMVPGTGPLIASFTAYALERKLAKDPDRFGKGAIEGVAAPEASNNSSSITHFIPMLVLGIPAGAPMALMLSALLIHGITPGPSVMTEHPDLFWGVIASMFIGNLMLLVLNLPMVGLWVRLLTIPYRFLYPAILVFCCIGVYSVNNSVQDVVLAAIIACFGYFLRRMDYSAAPLIMGLVLGPLLEVNFRRSMLLSHGDPLIFVERPISLLLLSLTLILGIFFTRSALKMRSRREREAAVAAEAVEP
jgi:TctA family transporter